ncbi:MAG TPA: hypothetical protein DEB39_06205 [Planctomycetaceae bacterium]|nr:hypothetical protein [Planctomycetaceae bacterium]
MTSLMRKIFVPVFRAEADKGAAQGESCGKTPVCLLLLVGFLAGLIVGFATKDSVSVAYIKVMANFYPLEHQAPDVPPASGEHTPTVTQPTDDEPQKPEGEEEKKKEEAEQPSGDAPSPFAAPIPAGEPAPAETVTPTE